jgi:hypothetical protein
MKETALVSPLKMRLRYGQESLMPCDARCEGLMSMSSELGDRGEVERNEGFVGERWFNFEGVCLVGSVHESYAWPKVD